MLAVVVVEQLGDRKNHILFPLFPRRPVTTEATHRFFHARVLLGSPAAD
jgi:hypothetical protein